MTYTSQDLLPKEKTFRDPVHDYIHIQHPLILKLIDSHEFQRLRRIKQLGTTSYIFHGAEHSRFSHSLGVYEIARRICDKFVRGYSIDREGQDGWDDSERLLTLCAALLHDVGHGPFSHTFESIFDSDHEAMTQAIITQEGTEINALLKEVSPDFPAKVASVIDKSYPNPQVVEMISSQIDADRMDYLQRDAYFTGVTYGAFDLTRILRVIRPHRTGIVFDIQGVHAVEDYIVSRYQMYMQVYFHRVSRGMEVTLGCLLQRAADLYKEDAASIQVGLLQPFFDNDYDVFDYLKLDDGVLMSQIAQWSDHRDETLAYLSKCFLDRRPLKSVSYQPGKDDELVERMTQLVEAAGYNPRYFVASNSSLDQPYDLYTNQSGKKEIRLLLADGTILPLSEISDLVVSLTGEAHGDHRLYVPRSFLDPQTDEEINLFEPLIDEFQNYIKNGRLHLTDETENKF